MSSEQLVDDIRVGMPPHMLDAGQFAERSMPAVDDVFSMSTLTRLHLPHIQSCIVHLSL